MRYHALAADYDGTLAHGGSIDEATWTALARLRDSGRKLVMVTGRELEELLALLPHPERFDRLVVENGAVIYCPATRQVRLTCPHPPPAGFVEELRRRGVERISVGRAIVATWEPHEDTVLHVIHELGLELQVIFNKGAVMVLPTGVNKATGLAAALAELGMSPHNVVSIGDGENDHALFDHGECGVAVANAVTALKAHADLCTREHHGGGVIELVAHLLADDLAAAAPALTRHHILLGHTASGELRVDPYDTNMMICGPSGSGKSTLTTGFLERLTERGYQYAIIDPEGDYVGLDQAVILGAPSQAPLVSELTDVLRDPQRGVAVNLLGVSVDHRPEFFATVMSALSELRARTGRPHWVVVDEAHHLLPAAWEAGADLPLRPRGTLYITVHPKSVARRVIATVDAVIAVGDRPDATIREFCDAAGVEPPALDGVTERAPAGQALYWRVGAARPDALHTVPPAIERRRHSRTYVEGNRGERSFRFRGPDGKLNLKAYNVHVFLQLGDGVDDDTWMHHLRNGDYSRWFRTQVKDPELAHEIEHLERDAAITPEHGRRALRAAVEVRYTLPSDAPSGIIDD